MAAFLAVEFSRLTPAVIVAYGFGRNRVGDAGMASNEEDLIASRQVGPVHHREVVLRVQLSRWHLVLAKMLARRFCKAFPPPTRADYSRSPSPSSFRLSCSCRPAGNVSSSVFSSATFRSNHARSSVGAAFFFAFPIRFVT